LGTAQLEYLGQAHFIQVLTPLFWTNIVLYCIYPFL